MKFLKKIDKAFAEATIFLIHCYQKTLSPDKGILSPILKGKICSHDPHCSEYGINALKRYGFFYGVPKILDRILSCLPNTFKMYDPEYYRVVFFSSAPIGVPFLQGLYDDKRFDVVGIVTQEDKPVGRGLQLTPNIIKTKSLEIGMNQKDIYTPSKINPEKSLEGKTFYERLKEKNADYFVVIAYGKILPKEILELPAFGPINIHGSLLPKYRGASPLQSVFLNSESKSGITIMHMDDTMDTGEIVDTQDINIAFSDTVTDLIGNIEKQGPSFLNATLWKYAKGDIRAQKQDEKQATYCQKITKQDGEIKINEQLSSIYPKYRAYNIWPKVFFYLNEKKVIIEELVLDKNLFENNKNFPLRDKEGNLNICIKSILLKPEGKKSMDFKSFKNGYLH